MQTVILQKQLLQISAKYESHAKEKQLWPCSV